jgi:hypothetical protein
MMAPRSEVMFHRKHIQVSGYDHDAAIEICFLIQGVIASFNISRTMTVDIKVN